MLNTLISIAHSWSVVDSKETSTENILKWILERNKNTTVQINKIDLSTCTPWFYDSNEGSIHNKNNSFFSIVGCMNSNIEQPIILQNEIGYLGIICKEFNGVMHFLMQAKIEPGNINCVQISPTIQATKSNFTQKHGGNKPPYLDYFLNASKYEIVVDQIQSEQSSRFYKKRNRNIIIRVEEEIPILKNFCWMTLGQIKRLMREDNLVNMDTRTVLSCIPFSKLKLTEKELDKLSENFSDKALFKSIFIGDNKNYFPKIYQYINNQKMFLETETKLIPLKDLTKWEMKNKELVCKEDYPFKVVFCDITIDGREVKHWTQPLFEANGIATFGLICCEKNGILKFLVHANPEIGCFDSLELGPTVQKEAIEFEPKEDSITKLFWEKINNKDNIIFNQLLSEEGGRFYHEQNRNIILKINIEDLPPLPEEYFLVDYKTLNELIQVNNTVNIQLRNLLSLLEV